MLANVFKCSEYLAGYWVRIRAVNRLMYVDVTNRKQALVLSCLLSAKWTLPIFQMQYQTR